MSNMMENLESTNMMFDNDNFCVVGMLDRTHGSVYELVDKHRNVETLLVGSPAAAFRDRVLRWQEVTPDIEEVQDTIEQFLQLNTLPLTQH